MIGSAVEISASSTWSGFVFFCSLTVAALTGVLLGLLVGLSWLFVATGPRRDGDSGTRGSIANLTVGCMESSLEGLVPSSCCLSKARCCGVEVCCGDCVVLTAGKERGAGRRSCGDTYGRPADMSSSIEVSNLTAAAVLPWPRGSSLSSSP